ncbi:hypothetical protein [Streptomyces sp. A244]|uniref:hypothetical protein n=1 Tax=Streptomyces sp. A244 TaxID=2137016 RepID=UPI0011B1E068|nr:hypothetical protein [Streptomyces sp. A244]
MGTAPPPGGRSMPRRIFDSMIHQPAEWLAAIAALAAIGVSAATCASQNEVANKQSDIAAEQNKLEKRQDELTQKEAIPNVTYYISSANPLPGYPAKLVVENRELHAMHKALITIHRTINSGSPVIWYINVDLLRPCVAYEFGVSAADQRATAGHAHILSFSDKLDHNWRIGENVATERIESKMSISESSVEWKTHLREVELESCG